MAKQWHVEQQRRRAVLAAEHLTELLTRRPELTPRDVSLLVLTGIDEPLADVTPERAARLRAHLRRTLDAIARGEQQGTDAQPASGDAEAAQQPPSRAVARACTLCRGYCCSNGAEHAFIGAATLTRVRAQQPELTDDALIARYVDSLPSSSVEGSCVFHGSAGCTLPRQLRSRICNEYYCEPVKQWLSEPAASGLRPAAAVVVRDARVRRSLLIED